MIQLVWRKLTYLLWCNFILGANFIFLCVEFSKIYKNTERGDNKNERRRLSRLRQREASEIGNKQRQDGPLNISRSSNNLKMNATNVSTFTFLLKSYVHIWNVRKVCDFQDARSTSMYKPTGSQDYVTRYPFSDSCNMNSLQYLP